MRKRGEQPRGFSVNGAKSRPGEYKSQHGKPDNEDPGQCIQELRNISVSPTLGMAFQQSGAAPATATYIITFSASLPAAVLQYVRPSGCFSIQPFATIPYNDAPTCWMQLLKSNAPVPLLTIVRH